MSRPFTRTYTPSDADADGYVDGGSGASLTLLASSAGDGLAHQLNFTSTADISDHTFTVVGTDADGIAQTEVVTGPNNTTVESTGYFLTVTSITPDATLSTDEVDIGWVDEFVGPTIPINWRASEVSIEVDVGGTINYTLRQTFDALTPSATYPAGPSASTLTWSNCTDGDLVAATTDQITNYDKPVTALQMQANSYSSGASVRINVVQADS